MFSFSRELVKLVLSIAFLEHCNLAVLGLTSLLLIRYLGSELFGVLQFFGVLASVPSVFHGQINYAIVRFVPTVSPRRQAEILLASTWIQAIVVGAVLLVGALLYLLLPEALFGKIPALVSPNDLRLALILLAVLAPTLMLHDTLNAFTAGLQRITASQLIGLSGSVFSLFAVVAVIMTVSNPVTGLLLVLGIRLLARQLGAVAYGVYLRYTCQVWQDLRALLPAKWASLCRSVYREFIQTYAQPLQIGSIFTFLRENLAVLVLGTISSMSQVAYYDIIRKIYEVPRRLLPDLVRTLIPRIVVSMDRDPVTFRRQFAEFTWLQLGFNALAGTLLLSFHPLILSLLKVPSDTTIFWIVFLFSVNLLLSAIAQSSGYVIQFGTDTSALLAAGVARSLVLTGASLVLIPLHAAVGATVSLVLASLFTLVFLAVATRGSRIWSLTDNVNHALVTLLVSLAWLVGYRALASGRPALFPWPF